jgi:hypothetical protein
VGRELLVVAVAAADEVLELAEPLAESATRLGDALGAEEDQSDGRQDDSWAGCSSPENMSRSFRWVRRPRP